MPGRSRASTLMAALHRRLQGAGPRGGRHGRARRRAHRAAPRRAPTATGPVPVPRGAHAVVRRRRRSRRSTTASAAGPGGDVFTFVHGDRGPRLRRRAGVRWPTATASSWSATSEDPRAAERRRAPRAAARAARAHRGLLRARAVGVAREAAGARDTSPSGGWRRRRCARFRVGYAPSAWDRVLPARAARASPTRSCSRPGWPARSQQERPALRPLPRADHVPAGRPARARARVRRRARCATDQQPKYLNSPEGDLYHKGRQLFGARPRARARPRRRGRCWSPRATPTCSRCTRRGSRTRSGSWAPR